MGRLLAHDPHESPRFAQLSIGGVDEILETYPAQQAVIRSAEGNLRLLELTKNGGQGGIRTLGTD
jgi:hypothetical protein